MAEDPVSKEKLLKYARNEQFKDENLGKALIGYIKAYESPEVIRNRLREREQLKNPQDRGEEKLGLSVGDLKKQINLMFLNKIDGPMVERAKGYHQATTNVLTKITKKIKDSEAFLSSRCLTMNTIRKENGQILEKIKSIRELLISIKEKMELKKNKTKQNVNANETSDSLPPSRGSITKSEKKNIKNNLLSAEKNNVQNFMQKALDEQIKGEEISQLTENKENFERKLTYNNEILLKMENENQTERKNLKDTQKLYRSFFFKLLQEGKDCR